MERQPAAGAAGRTRTADLLITNQLLYQLSHSSILGFEAVYMCVSSESPVTAFILYRINTGIAREIFAFLTFCVSGKKMRKEIPLPNLRKSTVRMYLSRTVDLLFITKFRTPGGKTRDPRNRLCRKTRGTPQLYVSYWTLDARYAVGKLDRCRGWVGIEVVPVVAGDSPGRGNVRCAEREKAPLVGAGFHARPQESRIL